MYSPQNLFPNEVCINIANALQDFDSFWTDYCIITNIEKSENYPNKSDKLELMRCNLHNVARGYLTKILVCKYYMKCLKDLASLFLDNFWYRKLVEYYL